ncbi:MAG: hypothetical protein GKR91_04710 [Pseudomonadales bacterium]|nr:hypothetical protein [Pseudomonadales bacterium]
MNTPATEEKAGKPILVGVAFLLPLLFVGVVFLSSYIPSARLSTDYDFLYSTCSEGTSPYYYNCGNYLNNLYEVQNQTLIELPISADLDSDGDDIADVDENYRTRLFFHDTETNTSREITLEEAQQYNLRELITSPDGVAVEWEYSRSRGYFIFYSTSSNAGYYLTKGDARKRLDLISDTERYYYRDDLHFLGWVIEP